MKSIGVVWCGVLWCDLVRYGVVWCHHSALCVIVISWSIVKVVM